SFSSEGAIVGVRLLKKYSRLKNVRSIRIGAGPNHINAWKGCAWILERWLNCPFFDEDGPTHASRHGGVRFGRPGSCQDRPNRPHKNWNTSQVGDFDGNA
ncbi:MAG: hypothetical protein AAGB11_18020, partial [Pseudomonadota bacterium]